MDLVLGIETSCDDTSASVVADGRTILSNVVSSQAAVHEEFGGVVPELASRQHLQNIVPVLEEAMTRSGAGPADLAAVAVTCGPGLVGALLVGQAAAKSLALAWSLPLVGVQHLAAHIYANFLERPELEPPLVCLVVSGGHSDLVYLRDHGTLELLGATRDDAAGEVFDKVARALDLGYPGGPAIQALAHSAVAGFREKEGLPHSRGGLEFPRAWLEPGSLDFSFSGLKTAVLSYLHRIESEGRRPDLALVAARFQEAVCEVLVEKTLTAARLKGVSTIALAGGVAANLRLREQLLWRGRESGLQVVFPRIELCTDNAAMVACLGCYRYRRGLFSPLDLNAEPSLPLLF